MPPNDPQIGETWGRASHSIVVHERLSREWWRVKYDNGRWGTLTTGEILNNYEYMRGSDAPE